MKSTQGAITDIEEQIDLEDDKENQFTLQVGFLFLANKKKTQSVKQLNKSAATQISERTNCYRRWRHQTFQIPPRI